MTLVCLDPAGAIRVSTVYQIYWGHSRSSEEDSAFPSPTWRRAFHQNHIFTLGQVLMRWNRVEKENVETRQEQNLVLDGYEQVWTKASRPVPIKEMLSSQIFLMLSLFEINSVGILGGGQWWPNNFWGKFDREKCKLLVHIKCKLHCSTHSFLYTFLGQTMS